MESRTSWYHLNDPRSRYGKEERTIIKLTRSSGGSASDTVGGGKPGQEQGLYLDHETLLQKKTDRSHSVPNKVMWGIWTGSNSRLLLCRLLLAMSTGDAALWAAEPAAPRWVTQQMSLLPAPTPTGPWGVVSVFIASCEEPCRSDIQKHPLPGAQKKAPRSKKHCFR